MARAVRSAKYGKIWKTSILGNPTIMVFDEAACRKVLKEEGRLVEVIWPDVTAELVCRCITEAPSASGAWHGLILKRCTFQRHALAPFHQGRSTWPRHHGAEFSINVKCVRAIIRICSFASMPSPDDIHSDQIT